MTLQDGKKDELIDMLKVAINKLISEIQITPSIRGILNIIMSILGYEEEEIKSILHESKDTKKKNFFTFFKGNN